MQPIIRVHNFSKRYRIGRVEPYYTLRESIVRSVTAPARLARVMLGGRARDGGAQEYERHVWALRDVSFDVMPGEVLGLIGRKAASQPDFTMYTDALKNYNVKWSEKTLSEFLVNPMVKVPNTTMPMMLPDDKERADVIAYLVTLK